jgi:hypothetical protein
VTNKRSFFDKAGEERTYQCAQLAAMNHQPTRINQLPSPLIENGRVYFAIIVGGATILLMILAEMKFFGT